ncbi:hypothetical protein H4R33_003442 [Dimargaris cristalligena]|uniref:Uncharacterized protein n=1 Tax=Dimargaris cristalligena TaxID=215637 RepID=A0A4V1J4V1_9FUNG|nr:hypothetical protein H4R33_003442 [Dimargaris cristalligena]RKP36839.1 hypothetical protein BJ085DRAFT_35631 [Dimargaris cristalligena]|eukprot:RKP36839.1 hypothetical protein BJ085DRAFT_35631 [Dimargaris cristalligena]
MSLAEASAIYQEVFSTLAQQGFKYITKRLARLPKSHRSVIIIIEAFAHLESDFLNLHFLKTKGPDGNPSGESHIAEINNLIQRVNQELQYIEHHTPNDPTMSVRDDPSALQRQILNFVSKISSIRILTISIILELYQKHNNSNVEVYIETLERCVETVEPFCKIFIIRDYATAILFEHRSFYQLLLLNEKIRRYDFFSSAVHMTLAKQVLTQWRQISQPQQAEIAKPEDASETSAWATLWNSLSESIYPGRTGYAASPLAQWLNYYYKALGAKMALYFQKIIQERESNYSQGELKLLWKHLESSLRRNIIQFLRHQLVISLHIYHFNDEGDSTDIHNFGFQLYTGKDNVPKTRTLTPIALMRGSSNLPDRIDVQFITNILQMDYLMLRDGQPSLQQRSRALTHPNLPQVYWFASIDSVANNFLVAVWRGRLKTTSENVTDELWGEILYDLRLTRAYDYMQQLSV